MGLEGVTVRERRFESDFDGISAREIVAFGERASRQLKNGSLPATRQRADSAPIELMAR